MIRPTTEPSTAIPEWSHRRQHRAQFEGRDLGAVLVELMPLVAQEEVEHVVAEGVSGQFGVLGLCAKLSFLARAKLAAIGFLGLCAKLSFLE